MLLWEVINNFADFYVHLAFKILLYLFYLLLYIYRTYPKCKTLLIKSQLSVLMSPGSTLWIEIARHCFVCARVQVALDWFFIMLDTKFFSNRTVCRWSGGSEDASLLPFRRHSEHSVENGVEWRSAQNSRFAGYEGIAWSLWNIPFGVQGGSCYEGRYHSLQVPRIWRHWLTFSDILWKQIFAFLFGLLQRFSTHKKKLINT